MFFPASREIVAELQQSMTEKDIHGNLENILIVDDEPLQRDIASQILTSLKYRVTAVGSGEEAVVLIEKDRFDLVVLDMIMSPGINGRMTYEQIVRIHPGQKAILVSGFTVDDEVKRAQNLGAGDYIKKPYTLKEIGRAVKKELARSSVED